MRKFIYLLLVVFVSASAQDKEEFDYNNIIVVAALKDDKNCVFAGFPTFLTMRDIISNAEKRFAPVVDAPTAYIYELFMVDENGISATVFLGDHWLSDGTQISQLSDEDFSFLTRVINARTFDNENSRLRSLTLDVNLATFKNELLKTQDYENIGRQPQDISVDTKPEKTSSDSNKKPDTKSNENIEDIKHSITNQSSEESRSSSTKDTRQNKADLVAPKNIQNIDNLEIENSSEEVASSSENSISALTILIAGIFLVLIWLLRKK